MKKLPFDASFIEMDGEEGERIAYPPEEAARQIGFSRNGLYQHIASGELKSIKVGKKKRLIKRSDLLAFLERMAAKAAAPLPSQLRQPQGGRRSRDKGSRAERAIVRFFLQRGCAAQRVPLSGAAGGRYVGDLTIPVVGRNLCAEVKVRAHGFGQLYGWLDHRDILVVRQDRREPLVVLALSLATEIARLAEVGHVTETTKVTGDE